LRAFSADEDLAVERVDGHAMTRTNRDTAFDLAGIDVHHSSSLLLV